MEDIFMGIRNPFSDYSTDYRRTKTLVTKGMVEPKEIGIGTRIDSRASSTQSVMATVQYVPLLDTLQLLMSKKEFRENLQEHE